MSGLVAMAERTLRGGGSEGGPPVEVVVTVDAATATGQTPRGGGLDREVVRRLCCDCGVVPVVTDARGTPMDVGRKRRTIPMRLRKALVARDRGCQFPGCTNHRWVDGHHIEHWLSGGETSLDNLVLLCRRHHRCLHELGFGLARGEDGAFVFTDPQGRTIDSHIRMDSPARPPVDLPPAPWPTTEGEIDYDACIDVLLQAHHAPGRPRVSFSTSASGGLASARPAHGGWTCPTQGAAQTRAPRAAPPRQPARRHRRWHGHRLHRGPCTCLSRCYPAPGRR